MKKTILTLTGTVVAVGLSACATIEEEVVDATSDTYHATLTGAAEVGPGDPEGRAVAEISVTDEFNQVCYEITDITGIGPITAAHVHFGRIGTNGPPVFTLTPSNEGLWQGCRDGAEWTQNRLQGNPEDFYVNLHTAEFPAGAIRGQLSE